MPPLRQVVSGADVPEPIGPYSQAVRAGRLPVRVRAARHRPVDRRSRRPNLRGAELAGLGLKEPVVPLGSPLTLRLTELAKPPLGVIVTV